MKANQRLLPLEMRERLKKKAIELMEYGLDANIVAMRVGYSAHWVRKVYRESKRGDV